MIAVEQLLRPVSADRPCGMPLEADNDLYGRFLELEKLAKPGPSRWDGSKDIPGRPPEWPQVESLALDLFDGGDAATKDLRVAVYLARARLHVAALPGFTEGLELVRGLLDTYWESVHPQIPEDDVEAVERVNALAPLGGEVVNELRRAPLITVPVVGPVSFRDIEIARGQAKPAADAQTLNASQIEGVFAECAKSKPDTLVAAHDAATAARAHADAIRAVLAERIGASEAGKIDPLRTCLAQVVGLLAEKLAAHGLLPVGADATVVDGAVPMAGVTAAGVASVPGEIAGRADVRRALERICDYYDRCEPSSPVPILLKRALRLVDMSFLDIVKDLAPGGLAQVEQLRGADSGD